MARWTETGLNSKNSNPALRHCYTSIVFSRHPTSVQYGVAVSLRPLRCFRFLRTVFRHGTVIQRRESYTNLIWTLQRSIVRRAGGDGNRSDLSPYARQDI